MNNPINPHSDAETPSRDHGDLTPPVSAPASINPPTPIVFGGQFQEFVASETITEGEARTYIDITGHAHQAEVVGSHSDGTVDILVAGPIARIRRDSIPWKKEGMTGNYVE